MPAAMPIYFLSRVLEARYCRRLREAASAAGANLGVGGGAGTQNQDRITPHVICRETEKEVKAVCCAILEGEDRGAVDGLMVTMTRGDQSSWRGHKRDQRIIGGNVHVFGTQEQVTEQLAGLHAAGCDGVQINFFDFAADLEFFGERVIPLLKDAGLRVD